MEREHPWSSILIQKNTFLDFADDNTSLGNQPPRYLRRNSAPSCLGTCDCGDGLCTLERASASAKKCRSISIASEASHIESASSSQEDDSNGKGTSLHSEIHTSLGCQGAHVESTLQDSSQRQNMTTWVAVPVVSLPIAPVAPCNSVYSEADAEQLMQQARDLAMKAKELEAKAWRLRNPRAKDIPQSTEVLWTTVMLRNIPNNITRAGLLEILERNGFPTICMDFLYLPMDFKRDANLGYAFLNLISEQEADRFFRVFQGFEGWGLASGKVGEVCWGQPLQGLDAHIDRYRNCPVMHSSVPEEHKPMLFCDGIRIQFPAPTKKLRAPRSC